MGQNVKKTKISFFNANFTPIASVTLVLMLCGLVALLMLAGKNLTNTVKENIGFNVVLNDNATSEQINSLKTNWEKASYTKDIEYISKEQALKEYETLTGENLMDITGVNPLCAEFNVRVKAQYAAVDSLQKITAPLLNNPAVSEINIQKNLIDKINKNINNLALVLIAVAAILLIISIVLINNTIRISIYSQRFLIYTMKLVGAKAGFIRKPFIIKHLRNGFIAGILAALILAGAYIYMQTFNDLIGLISTIEIAIVIACILLLGMMISSLAALFATNKFLNQDYDSLFLQ